jgi:hypothetical protein
VEGNKSGAVGAGIKVIGYVGSHKDGMRNDITGIVGGRYILW